MATITAALAVAIAGLVLRDRIAILAWCTYLPVPVIAGIAVAVDSAGRGRGWRRAPFGLTIVALCVTGWWGVGMIGFRSPNAPPAGDQPLTLLHWNTRWGGGRSNAASHWPAMLDHVASISSDVVVLSEAPRRELLDRVPERLGAGSSMQWIEHAEGERYWYRLAVASRFPVTLLRRDRIASGVTMLCEVAMPRGPLRVLVVDAESAPWRDRRPTLADLAALLDELAAADTSPHVLAGDFNAPSRSVGFDALRHAGYSLAADVSGEWRGTWRSDLPLYDIDQVWLAPGMGLHACDVFTGPHSDHRGQVVEFSLHPQAQ